jgi:hypothetical protein
MNKDLQYRILSDSNGKPLDGSRNYLFHLPSNMPAANFWSVIVYDLQNQLIIQSGQAWPSVHSNSKKLVLNPDNSVDIWFGPEAPESMENNWIQTVPGKDWYMVLRLYELHEYHAHSKWIPGKIKSLN